MAELEQLLNGRYNVLCITETQLKINKIKANENCVAIENMREVNDRKGGGLMILYKDNDDMIYLNKLRLPIKTFCTRKEV